MRKKIETRDRRILRLKKKLDEAIKDYREKAGETGWKLEGKLLREIRGKKQLSKQTLRDIGDWKSQNRNLHWIEKNRPQDIGRTTRLAFRERDVRKKLTILSEGLLGVANRTASAILMFHNPRRYTVMDEFAWTVLHEFGFLDEPPSYYGAQHYVTYLDVCKQLSEALSISLRKLDRGLWVLGKEISEASDSD
ncbi:MAG: hypothetical protein ACE5KV_01100 [Thermoplasmata archaeon]